MYNLIKLSQALTPLMTDTEKDEAAKLLSAESKYLEDNLMWVFLKWEAMKRVQFVVKLFYLLAIVSFVSCNFNWLLITVYTACFLTPEYFLCVLWLIETILLGIPWKSWVVLSFQQKCLFWDSLSLQKWFKEMSICLYVLVVWIQS